MIRLIDERVMEKLRDKPENIDLEEFMPLVGEWREEKVSKAKCPYCVKPIEKQATKCNHCLSELEWFKFDGLYGPCKAGASEEMEAALLMVRATLHAAIEAEEEAKKAAVKAKFEKIEKRLTQIQMAGCRTCGGPVFTSSELQDLEAKPYLKRMEYRHSWRNGYRCSECIAAVEKRAGLAFLIIGVALFFFLVWLAHE
ncbi:hypothetical protein OAE47_03295 [Akkermansiaceae bacterium]|nr:hypothetical protein [Akkermansiaceae bacterium]MDB4727106.1 hypothetical protein [bacterium]